MFAGVSRQLRWFGASSVVVGEIQIRARDQRPPALAARRRRKGPAGTYSDSSHYEN